MDNLATLLTIKLCNGCKLIKFIYVSSWGFDHYRFSTMSSIKYWYLLLRVDSNTKYIWQAYIHLLQDNMTSFYDKCLVTFFIYNVDNVDSYFISLLTLNVGTLNTFHWKLLAGTTYLIGSIELETKSRLTCWRTNDWWVVLSLTKALSMTWNKCHNHFGIGTR